MKRSIFNLLIAVCLLSAPAYGSEGDTTKCKKHDKCIYMPEFHMEIPPMPEINVEIPRIPEFPELAQLDLFHELGDLSLEFSGTREERNKTLSSSFSINEHTAIFLRNKYGDVNIETVAGKTFDIRVEITVKAANEKKAEELLENIKVEMKENKTANSVEVTTDLSCMKGVFNNVSFEINYFVKMPPDNPLTVKNSFGNVNMPDHNGKLDLQVSYGKITAGSLNNKFTNVLLSFGRGTVTAIPAGVVSTRYSNFSLERTKDLELKSEFSDVRIAKAGKIDLYSRYGSVRFGELGFVKGNSQFAGISIERLSQGADLSVRYCQNLRIKTLQDGFKNITVNLMYSDMIIESLPNDAFDFNVALRFGSMSAKGPTRLTELNENHKNTYIGGYGEGSSNRLVHITGEYSRVKFNTASQ